MLPQVRDLATQRSQLDSKQRPMQHYTDSGGHQRLEDVSMRLGAARERMRGKEYSLEVGACTHTGMRSTCGP